MLAVFGYGAQAVITGDGPWKNLLDHLSDPTGHNLLTNFGSPAL
jgi:light-harvesting complex I chlorophyll a/b binding protein 3